MLAKLLLFRGLPFGPRLLLPSKLSLLVLKLSPSEFHVAVEAQPLCDLAITIMLHAVGFIGQAAPFGLQRLLAAAHLAFLDGPMFPPAPLQPAAQLDKSFALPLSRLLGRCGLAALALHVRSQGLRLLLEGVAFSAQMGAGLAHLILEDAKLTAFGFQVGRELFFLPLEGRLTLFELRLFVRQRRLLGHYRRGLNAKRVLVFL